MAVTSIVPISVASLILALFGFADPVVPADGQSIGVSAPAKASLRGVARPLLRGGPYLSVDLSKLRGTSRAIPFRLERRGASGWARAGRYRARGPQYVRLLPVKRGTYRVLVKRGKRVVSSPKYAYIPRPSVTFTGGADIQIDVDPDLRARAAWWVTMERQRKAGWRIVERLRTRGRAEKLRLDYPSGVYRVVTKRRGRFPRSVSRPFAYEAGRPIDVDRLAPQPVRDLVAAPEESSVKLSWVNPLDTDLERLLVRRRSGATPPVRPADGDAVPLPTVLSQSVTDKGLQPDTDYAYSVFAVDTNGNTSSAASVTMRTLPVAVRAWLTTADRTSLLTAQPSPQVVGGATPENAIRINPSVTYQQYQGVGAAMTESSAWLLDTLPAVDRAGLMKEIFGSGSGLGVNLLRVPMGASDFALGDYTYDDVPSGLADPTLSLFSISRDEAYVLPGLRQALSANPELRVVASPWSAPAWMKTSGRLEGGRLDPSYRDAYAQYFVRFLNAYRDAGIDVDTLTVQNEPMHETTGYPSMGMTAAEQALFIRDHLSPALQAAGLAPDILALDHNWDLDGYAGEVLRDPVVRDLVAGVAFHCYGGAVKQQTAIRTAYPSKSVWLTECSGGEWSPEFGDNMNWMMQNLVVGNFRNWGQTMLLWNLALDPRGGPTNGGCSNCRGVVTIDPSDDSVVRNEEYYALGHVTRVVDPGARRIGSTGFGPGGPENVAFLNPDGSIGLIVHSTTAQTFTVDAGKGSFSFDIPARGTVSFRWRGAASRPAQPHPGGLLQGFERNGSYYPDHQVDARLARDVVRSGSASLRATGASGYWHTVGAYLADGPIDVSKLNRLCVWVHETGVAQSGNTLGLRLIDANGNSQERWSDHKAVGANPKTVSGSWVQMCFALKAFDLVDLTDLERVQFAVYWPGTYHFDELTAVP